MENNLYLSKFWTRVWAILIDILILGIFGHLLGLLFQNQLISLGENAKAIGWIISLCYFTILNSQINNGQTIGKKLMNIQVTDIAGNTIPLKNSLIRALVLTTPFFLNGYRMPGASLFSIVTLLQTVVIFTFGIGSILLYIFNNETRQAVHDIIAKTYVVLEYRNDEVTLMQKPGKLPLFILGTLFLISSCFAFYSISSNTITSKLTSAYESIIKLKHVSNASVHMNATPMKDSMGVNHFIYTVTINTTKNEIKEDVTNPEIRQTVEAFINNKPNKTDDDILSIIVNSGFDLGIAKRNKSFSIYRTIHDWKETYNIKASQ